MKTKLLMAVMVVSSLLVVSDADACCRRRLFNRDRHHHNGGCGCASQHSCCESCGQQPCCCDDVTNVPHDHYNDCNDCVNPAIYYGDRQDLYAQTRPRRPRAVKQWPWHNDEEELPPPTPEPDPLPVPDDPLPEPTPEPQPDPQPIPDEPQPEPGPTPSIPADPTELNTYVANHLGGFVRANHSRNGATLDIYQARGKQRIVYVTAEAADWMSAIGRAFYLKALAGSSHAGVVLVCNDPSHPAPEPPLEPTPAPQPAPEPAPPEPLPAPDVEPLPAPDVQPAPEPGEIPVAVLKRCGGQELVDAQMACEASGAWLVVVRRYGGEVNRVIYNPGP